MAAAPDLVAAHPQRSRHRSTALPVLRVATAHRRVPDRLRLVAPRPRPTRLPAAAAKAFRRFADRRDGAPSLQRLTRGRRRARARLRNLDTSIGSPTTDSEEEPSGSEAALGTPEEGRTCHRPRPPGLAAKSDLYTISVRHDDCARRLAAVNPLANDEPRIAGLAARDVPRRRVDSSRREWAATSCERV